MEHFDICIIGAGPAGATTSLTLSKMQIKHLIVDKASFPRDKICGDGLDTKVMRVLNALSPDYLEEMRQTPDHYLPVWGVRFGNLWGHSSDFVTRHTDMAIHDPVFFTAKRMHFDQFLVNKVASDFADFRAETEVTHIEKTEQGFMLTLKVGQRTYDVSTKLLVGADGDHSVVLRKVLQRKIDRDHYAGGLRMYMQNVEGIHPNNLIEIHYLKELPLGYFWIFPLPNGEANIGLGMQSSVLSTHKYKLREAFELILNDSRLAERFKNAKPIDRMQGWGLPLAGNPRTTYGDHFILTGDAGSMIDPISGEGIGNGMLTGYIAAHYAQRAQQTGNYKQEMFAHYQHESRKRVADSIRFYKLMSRWPKLPYDTIFGCLIAGQVPALFMRKKYKQWLQTAKKPIPVDFS